MAAVAVLLVGAQVARAGGLQQPPPAPPPPAEPPFSGISQYVEQIPTAGGGVDADHPAGPTPNAGQLPPKLKKSIAGAGKDAKALTRLVMPVAAVGAKQATKPGGTTAGTSNGASGSSGSSGSSGQTTTPATPAQQPQAKPTPQRAAVEQTERKALHDDNPSPVSAAAVSAVLDTAGSATGSRLLALVAVLAGLTVVAAVTMRRRRSTD
jgi:hypothetical protein